MTTQWMVNRWPLIERHMSRADCLAWLRDHGFPQPPKSACVGCPFHNHRAWQQMRDERPEEFADAVAVDAALRHGNARGVRGVEFMHPARLPLREAVEQAVAERDANLNLFENECEGMCGV